MKINEIGDALFLILLLPRIAQSTSVRRKLYENAIKKLL